jgi:preprotein translocase subunit YajC
LFGFCLHPWQTGQFSQFLKIYNGNMNNLPDLSSLIVATTANSSNPSFVQSLLGGPFMMVVVIMAMMYMLWIRPEQKRAKEHRETVQRAKAGDRIVTTAGIHGVIRGVGDKTLNVEIAKDVCIELDRGAIARMMVDAPEKK